MVATRRQENRGEEACPNSSYPISTIVLVQTLVIIMSHCRENCFLASILDLEWVFQVIKVDQKLPPVAFQIILAYSKRVTLEGVWQVPDSDWKSRLGVFKSHFLNPNQTYTKL